MKQRFFKKMIVLILSVVMVASLFPVCVMAAGNTYQDATEISLGKEISGSISDYNTVDFYEFYLPSSGIVRVEIQTKVSMLKSGLYYGDEAKESVFTTTNYIYDDFYFYRLNLLTAGKYYFMVERGNTTSRGTGSYTFTVKFEGSNESFNGTDNSFADANTVEFNKKYIGFLAENDTVDYYKFVLPPDTEVVIEATAYVDSIYYKIYDGDGELIPSRGPQWNSYLERSNKKITCTFHQGTYYFIVGGGYGLYEFSISADVPAPAQTGWIKSGSDWYYYDSLGKMVTGWQQIRGVWYFFNSEGIMQTGWVQSGKKWYYMNSEGAMVTGWKLVGSIWYYFNSDGVMQTGWVLDAGRWYYFNNDGAMQIGWKYIGGEYYYLKSDGTMAEKEYCGGYWLGSGGAWTYKYKASWKKDSTGWWYGDDSGWYARSETLKIDGKDYNFNSSGYCTNP